MKHSETELTPSFQSVDASSMSTHPRPADTPSLRGPQARVFRGLEKFHPKVGRFSASLSGLWKISDRELRE
ncbi:hypothetical protein [Tichowtungia aerotolerans]|uniref:Uncharacterized protein n=1 Tax=Tichowtungia aerotolerans TaxID=2697043 RepID=A0A6P1M4Y8_9BACT|nr:hypothetical protein [Tichowtungia aerotolerans]QHI69859.1 hypothetical protein GT409_10480 [Tichowtungia aerotolerans]